MHPAAPPPSRGSTFSIRRIRDALDPRLGDFTRLRDVQLRTSREAAEGMFVAEGERTIRRAVAAGYEARAVLLTERWLAPLTDLLERIDAHVLVVGEDVLRATTGFPVHRGALASMSRRPVPEPEKALAGARLVAVLEDLTDHTNIGAVFRSAAALGVDAVALTPRCADPLYRRAIRTSMGAVFDVPWTRIHWRDGPGRLRGLGFRLIALTPAEDAVSLADVDADDVAPAALALGNEGTGLSMYWLGRADLRVRIPMHAPIDSLNVAVAASVAFYALRSGR